MRFSLILGLAATPVFCFVFSELSTAPQLLAAPLVSQAETAATLYQTGQRLFYQGQFSQALDSLQQALQKAQAEADRQIEADAWTAIATLHLALEDKALGREAIDRALALHEDLQDPVGRAEALRVLAQAQFDVESDEAVLAIAEEALAIFRAEGAQLQEGILLADLGALAVQRQRYESGLEQLAQAAQIIEIAPAETNLERDYYRGLAQVWQGIAYIGLQDFEQAQVQIAQALTISQEASTPLVEGSARFLQGLLDEIRSDYEAALANHHSSAAIFTELGTRGALREVLVRMGQIYKSQGEAQDDHPELAISLYQNAVEVFQQALAIAAERKDSENTFNHRLMLNWLYTMISQRYMDLARTQLDAGEFNQALSTFDQSIAAGQQAVDMAQPIEITPSNAAQVNLALGMGSYVMGEAYQFKGMGFIALQQFNDNLEVQQRALAIFQASLPYAAASENPELERLANQRVTASYVSIGQAQAHLGNYEAGVAALETGLVHVRRIGDFDQEQQMLWLLQILYANWGEQYRIAGEYEQAVAVLHHGIAIGEERLAIIERSPNLEPTLSQQTLGSQWTLYSNIALVNIDQSNYASALIAEQQALDIANQLDAPDLKLATLSGLATAYNQLSRYPEALNVLQQQREMVQGDTPQEILVNMFIASIYSTVGRYLEAESIYTQALDWVRSQGSLRDESIILNNLGLLYENLGDYAQALETLNQALDLTHRLRTQLEAPDAIDHLDRLCSSDSSLEEQSLVTDATLASHQEYLDLQGLEQTRQGCIEITWSSEQKTLNNIAVVYASQGRYREALDLHQEALEIVRSRLRDRNSEAANLGNMSGIYWQQGDYAQALELEQQALEIYRATGAQDGVVGSLNDISVIFQDQGLYAQARETLEQALTLAREIGVKPVEVSILGNLGTVYSAQGQYERAEEYHTTSLDLSRELGLKNSEAIGLVNLGHLSGSRGQYDQALAYEEQALAIFEGNGSIGSVASTRLAIGAYQRAQGHYVEALDQQQQALAIFQEIGDRNDEAYALEELGITYLDLGQADKALEYHQAALSINREIGHRVGEAKALGLKGLVYDDQGQYEQALQAYEQALAIRRDIGDLAGESTSLTHMGLTYEQLGNYAAATTAFQQALEIQQRIGARSKEGLTLNGLALAYAGQGNYTEALDLQQQSLALHRELGDRPNEAKVLSDMGRLFADQDQPELAIVFLKASVNLTETLRGELQSLSTEDQASFAESVSDRYRDLADLLLQQDRVLEAQRVLDLLKVQELDDYLRGVRRNAQTNSGVMTREAEAEILRLYETAENELIQLGREREQLRLIPVGERTEAQAARLVELRQLEKLALEKLQEFLVSQAVTIQVERLRRTTEAANLELRDLNALRNNLLSLREQGQETVVLYPLVLDDRLELILVTADTVPVRRTTGVDRIELNRVIGNFRYALESPGRDAETPAKQLYDWLIRPLADDLTQAEADTIIYAPDEQLRYIPLAALHDGEQWLAQAYRVNNITAASLSDLDNAPAPGGFNVLAAAFTEGEHQVQVGDKVWPFKGLTYAGREVENLARLVPQTVQRLNQAFDPGILFEMNDYRIVHLATHAAFNPGPPENSFIVFGNGEHANLIDIAGWSFPNVELIILSACETAVGDVPLGDGKEILGFGYQMQTAGAAAVIASLWSVDDGGAQLLMNAFYDALSRGGLTKAAALQQAQIALIQAGEQNNRGGFELALAEGGLALDPGDLSHPFYWAPFILIGNGL
ncbi:MAG: tetratricopeptide repeat protein [Pseudanabaenales cyanobacterium]|nr:tetratricopeptide repeat protein [Pseudanabaenales cyanobacterium]